MATSEKDLLDPTLGCIVNPEFKYPRKVKPDPGVPAGWFAVEQAYGSTSKYAGQIYTRYSSFDGRFKTLGSAKKAIETHAADQGIDPKPLLEEYARLQKDPPEGSRLWKLKEQKKREAEEREAQGRLKGERREQMIAKFEDKFGKLSGPVVFEFPGWKTRWDYQPDCAQVRVMYTDPAGGEWFLLKDVECALMALLESGEPGPGGSDVGKMLEIGFANADPAKFSVGSRTARETAGAYEMTAEGEVRTMTREESKIDREQTHEAKAAEKPKKKKRRLCYKEVRVSSEGPVQEGWAKLGSEHDVQLAFSEYRRLLASRGFSTSIELVAVHGLTKERRYASRITGVYFCKGPYEGRSCYQKLMHAPRLLQGMCCDSIYIIWNSSESRWEFTNKPEPRQPCIAYCSSDSEEQLASVKASWHMQEGFEAFTEEKSLSVIVDRPGSPTGAA